MHFDRGDLSLTFDAEKLDMLGLNECLDEMND